jgi:hypothetical protein
MLMQSCTAVHVHAQSDFLPGQYWDTNDNYHYIRVEEAPHAGGKLTLIVGGEDHPVGMPTDSAGLTLLLCAWCKRVAESST